MKLFLMLLTFISLQSCSENHHPEYKKVSPANLIKNEDGSIKVVLTDKAYERLGIELKNVSVKGDIVDLPSSALIYDNYGGTWVYVHETERSFHKVKVGIQKIFQKTASVSFFNDGDYTVVVSGVAELYGTESGVGK